MKIKIIVLLLITAILFCGCNIIQNDKDTKINAEELEDMGYVIYEEEEIIDGVREIYQGMTVESLTSFVTTMEMIKENMPIENIREYSDGYIIEYPLENRIFVIVTDKNGNRRTSFMRTYKERTEKDIKKLKSGMSEEEVKALFPEIEMSEWSESEIILNNNEIVRLVFEEKVLKEIEYTTYPFGESQFQEIMNIEEGKIIPRRTLLVMDGKLIKGEDQLEEFIAKKEQGAIDETGEKEILKIKYVYTDEDDEDKRVYDYILSYEEDKYLLESLDYNTGKTYDYLIKLRGKSMTTGKMEEAYFLTDNKDLTYEELEFKILASSSTESLDGRKIFLIN